MKKIIINKKYYGKTELPKTRNAYKLFVLTVKTFSSNEEITLKTIYSENRLKSFEIYQSGGCADELLELDMFIELGKLLKFDIDEAKGLTYFGI